jgi:hypothetical protein
MAARNGKMVQQVDEENPMKTEMLLLAGAVLLSTVMASKCQAQSRALEANVPFPFEVGDKIMPAGSYRIESLLTGSGSLEVIRSTNGEVRVTVSTIAVPVKNENSRVEWIFHCYRSHNFLVQIQTGDGHGRQLFRSQLEKKLAGSEARNEIALLTHVTAGRP